MTPCADGRAGRPCVSSLVGDQFVPGQEKYFGLVFPMLYFFINLGSLLSTFLTPYIQATLDYDVGTRARTCVRLPLTRARAAAFAVPAVLLAVAVIVFAIGKRLYRIVPPGANMFYEMFVVLRSGIRTLWLVGLCCRCRRVRRARVRGRVRFSCCRHVARCVAGPVLRRSPHGARGGRARVRCVPRTLVLRADAHARALAGHTRVSSVRAILRVLTIFAPMPLFWALFGASAGTRALCELTRAAAAAAAGASSADQHSSTWVFQAGHMDLQVGSVLLRKTQIPAVNPMMTLLMIPVFRFVLYPLSGKCVRRARCTRGRALTPTRSLRSRRCGGWAPA